MTDKCQNQIEMQNKNEIKRFSEPEITENECRNEQFVTEALTKTFMRNMKSLNRNTKISKTWRQNMKYRYSKQRQINLEPENVVFYQQLKHCNCKPN